MEDTSWLYLDNSQQLCTYQNTAFYTAKLTYNLVNQGD